MLAIFESLTSIAASVATVVALYAIYLQLRDRAHQEREKADNKTRQTFELLHVAFTSAEGAELRRRFLEIVSGPMPISAYAGKSFGEEVDIVRRVLNQYELLCIFGKRALIDVEAMELFCGDTLVRDIDRCREFIDAERKTWGSSGWIEAEEIALKWKGR